MTLDADIPNLDAGPDKYLPAKDVETAPENDIGSFPKLPERQARQGFMSLLSQIAEEPEFSEADRSIGVYECHDEEWESWKNGPKEYEDEYDSDVGSDSDGTQSVATVVTAKLPRGRHASISKLSKLHTSKAKAMAPTGGSKRKRRDLSEDRLDDAESESEEGENLDACRVRC
jgi:hypothetical protein